MCLTLVDFTHPGLPHELLALSDVHSRVAQSLDGHVLLDTLQYKLCNTVVQLPIVQ